MGFQVMEVKKRRRVKSFSEPWKALVLAVGSVPILADVLEVNQVTVRRWIHGDCIPYRKARENLILLSAELGLEPPI